MAPTCEELVDRIVDFVVEQLAVQRAAWRQDTPCPPLVVGMQGPQGAGEVARTSHFSRLAGVSFPSPASTDLLAAKTAQASHA